VTAPTATRTPVARPAALAAEGDRAVTRTREPATARRQAGREAAAEAELLLATGPCLSRPVPAGSRVVAPAAAPSASAPSRPTTQLPDPQSVSCSIAQAAAEVLAGIRPVAQLTRWVTPEVFGALATRAAIVVRQRGRGAAPRVTVRRVRVCRLSQLVAEASVVLDDGNRVHAAAIRLEGHRGYWRATVLEIG
jgi:hypothetical protein